MNKQKIGAATGLATPIVAFTCISISIASWPEFNWIDNALSDLGVAPGFTAPVFNFGLTASGVLAFCFAALGIYSFLSTRVSGESRRRRFRSRHRRVNLHRHIQRKLQPHTLHRFSGVFQFGTDWAVHFDLCVLA